MVIVYTMYHAHMVADSVTVVQLKYDAEVIKLLNDNVWSFVTEQVTTINRLIIFLFM